MNMVNMNSSGTLVGPHCGMMDGCKISPILQYGLNGWIMNMPIRTRFDSHGGTQIEVTPGNGLNKRGREEVSYISSLHPRYFCKAAGASYPHRGPSICGHGLPGRPRDVSTSSTGRET